MFKNDQEDRYFKLFSTQTASQLTGLFASNVWDRLVLQVCERNSSVRHAVIALGALDPGRGEALTLRSLGRRAYDASFHITSTAWSLSK
jgi:hypothetical protein